MTASVFTSAIYGGLFSDPEVEAALNDRATVAAMIRFEAGLARAQAALEVIPAEDGIALATALDEVELDPSVLRDGAASSGVPVPALLAALRAQLPDALARWLHWGATSQDVIDTALMLQQRAAHDLIAARMKRVAGRLVAMADAHRGTPTLGRTWGQHAAPMSFGLVAANWLAPLATLWERRVEMERRVFALQLGGAVGDLSAMGPHAVRVRDRLAEDLRLTPAPPWHAQRGRVTEIAAWMADLAAALGKFGADLVLLTQSELAEVRLGASGASSTMPQKRNPVAPSGMVALARFALGQHASLTQAGLHGQQRDGQAWLLEWAALPMLTSAVGGAARRAEEIVAGLEPDPARMRANLDAAGAAPFAEAISFALARHMPLPDAQALVKAASRSAPDGDLVPILQGRVDIPIDWARVVDPVGDLGQADALINEIIAASVRAGLVAPMGERDDTD